MNERREQMLSLINREGTVSFSGLKQAFPNVSEMTLRNDLKYLDAQHQIVRVHGGARSVRMVVGTDDLFARRAARNPEEKKLIAQKALGLLKPQTAVFLDSGSTAIIMATQFPDESFLLFTTGINCAMELSRLEQPTTYLLGGKLNRTNLSVHGQSTVQEIENLNFNIFFLGTTGFSRENGFNSAVEAEAHLKRAVIKRAEKVVVLMDSQKVGIVSPFTFARLKDVDVVVSDGGLDEETIAMFEANGIQVL